MGETAAAAQVAATAIALPSLHAAKAQFPELIEKALKDGPPEAVFVEHWAPGAEFHNSLKGLLTRAAAAIQAGRAAVAPADGPPRATVQVNLSRRSDGDFWGFLCNKEMKVLQVNKESPADKAGLKKGWTVVMCGAATCIKSGDVYGEKKALSLALTVSETPNPKGWATRMNIEAERQQAQEDDDDMSADAPQPEPPDMAPGTYVKEGKDDLTGMEIRPGDWMCARCEFHNFAERSTCKRCGCVAPLRGAKNIGWGGETLGGTTAMEWRQRGAGDGWRPPELSTGVTIGDGHQRVSGIGTASHFQVSGRASGKVTPVGAPGVSGLGPDGRPKVTPVGAPNVSGLSGVNGLGQSSVGYASRTDYSKPEVGARAAEFAPPRDRDRERDRDRRKK